MHGVTGWRGALVAALVLLAGCSGGVTTFEADAAAVADGVVAETDYEFNGTTEETVERRVEVAGVEQTVTVINRVSTYGKAMEIPGAGSQKVAAVTVLSSPSVGVAGSEFNPLAEFTPQDLADTVGDQREGLSVGERTGESTVETLGTQVTVTQFAGTQSLGPTNVEVAIHVTKLKHDGNFVAVFAVYPQQLNDGETVRRMIAGLVHPA
jgi:hypothetical protein